MWKAAMRNKTRSPLPSPTHDSCSVRQGREHFTTICTRTDDTWQLQRLQIACRGIKRKTLASRQRNRDQRKTTKYACAIAHIDLFLYVWARTPTMSRHINCGTSRKAAGYLFTPGKTIALVKSMTPCTRRAVLALCDFATHHPQTDKITEYYTRTWRGNREYALKNEHTEPQR